MIVSQRSLEFGPTRIGAVSGPGAGFPVRGEVWLLQTHALKDDWLRRRRRDDRHCLVVSPDELNKHLKTVLVAPLTSVGKNYPFRVHCTFQHRRGLVVLDQIAVVDRIHLVSRVGILSPATLNKVLKTLQEMFVL